MTLTSEDSGLQVPQVPQVLQVRAAARPSREAPRRWQRKGRACPPPMAAQGESQEPQDAEPETELSQAGFSRRGAQEEQPRGHQGTATS